MVCSIPQQASPLAGCPIKGPFALGRSEEFRLVTSLSTSHEGGGFGAGLVGGFLSLHLALRLRFNKASRHPLIPKRNECYYWGISIGQLFETWLEVAG